MDDDEEEGCRVRGEEDEELLLFPIMSAGRSNITMSVMDEEAKEESSDNPSENSNASKSA